MQVSTHRINSGSKLRIHGPLSGEGASILSDEALAFLGELAAQFGPAQRALLDARESRRARLEKGEPLRFLPETRAIREAPWTVAPLPADLLDRRVEITGPTDRKMVINALNSGALVFMADFEDSTSPTWKNVIEGQVNLRDAIRRTIEYTAPDTKKHYRLCEAPATLMVRPRGLHLDEAHVHGGERPIPASLFDFGLYFFHNARHLMGSGSGPYFYLPKLESHREARWWNDVFVYAERRLGLPVGTIKATVLIETLPAAFEMDEILHALRDHSAGLNCGRWDYIFSAIKTYPNDPTRVLPDRSQVGMTQPFMRAYTQLAIRTCHRRGVHAMGGMAAQIPIRDDEAKSRAALDRVRADKLREVADGHDGTWVAHPGLVPIAREVFDRGMPGKNQIDKKREDVVVTEADLLEPPKGTRTEEGLRHNIRVGVQYLEAWLRGVGCVPLYDLMEDAATAEICRAQIWQWIRHGVSLDGGAPLTADRFRDVLAAEMDVIRSEVGEARFLEGRFEPARHLFDELVTADELAPFLTQPAYEALVRGETKGDPA